MPDNTPETQDPLPVTQLAREAVAKQVEEAFYDECEYAQELRQGMHDSDPNLQHFARFERDILARQSSNAAERGAVDERALRWIKHNLRLAEQMMKASVKQGNGYANFAAHDAHHALSVALAALPPSALSGDNNQRSSNAGGVDEAKKRTAINGILAGLLLPLVADPKELIALGNQACTEILASLSTPMAEPMRDETLRAALATIQAMIGNVDHSRGHGPNAAEMRGGMLNDIRDLCNRALTTPPTPDRIGKDAVREALPKRCDGIEQPAFEEWAAAQGFDMTEHPLHYLFLDAKTDAARQAWCAGIKHASDRIAALSATPAQQGEGRWTLVHCSHCDELPQEDKS